MKKYIVTFQKTLVAQITVEANTRDEAEVLAWKLGPNGPPMQWRTYDIIVKNRKMISFTPGVKENAQISQAPQT